VQATDTSAIQRVIDRARRRIRGQWALEGAATATILAAAAALTVIFLIRIEAIGGSTGTALLVGAVALVALGAAAKAARRIDDELVARRIDRASNLADRLSTAIAFSRAPAAHAGDAGHEDTYELMRAAIRDGVRAVPRADVRRATPFTAPADLRAALGFLAISALAAGLAIPTVDRTPQLYRAEPDHGAAGDAIVLRGQHLMTGVGHAIAALPVPASLGAPNVPAAASGPDARAAARGYVPADTAVYLGRDRAHPATILDWRADQIVVRIPEGAALGETTLTAWIGEVPVGPVAFTVVDRKDPTYHKPGSVALDPDDRAYLEALLAELRAVAQRDRVPELAELVRHIEQLLEDAELGKITKEQLLDALARAEDKLREGSEPDPAQLNKQLSELGKELAKSQLTKELGDALQNHDLDKAKQELEKLADQLDPQQLSDKDKEALAKLDEQKQKLEDDIRRLENDKQQAKTEAERQDAERRLDKKKDELEQLDKERAEKQQAARDELKRLERDDPKRAQTTKPLTDKDKAELAKQLDKAAKQLQVKEALVENKDGSIKAKLLEEIRRLENKKEAAKSEPERLAAERQLDKKKDELKQLDKDQQAKDQSAQRQALKRLSRDLEKAAESLQKPQNDPDQKNQDPQDQQASQKLRDAARETGRVDQDQRKQAAQKKLSSQMDDLREAMRRAKQKGQKGPQDPFGKQGKNQDFAQRARGGKGQGQAWKPGSGQQPGQGQRPGGQGGPGQQPGGKEAGVGHDDNLVGDPTAKSGDTKDADLQGQQGGNGGGTRETILSAAQKGFASQRYRDVYGKYHQIVEEVMRTEKLPSSYKYYVKRYFAKIHPSTGAAPAADSQDNPP
jgi:hypothetical protein